MCMCACVCPQWVLSPSGWGQTTSFGGERYYRKFGARLLMFDGATWHSPLLCTCSLACNLRELVIDVGELWWKIGGSGRSCVFSIQMANRPILRWKLWFVFRVDDPSGERVIRLATNVLQNENAPLRSSLVKSGGLQWRGPSCAQVQRALVVYTGHQYSQWLTFLVFCL